MKCIAIDDEPVALSIIEQLCKRCGDLEVTSYTDPITGLEKVNGYSIPRHRNGRNKRY